MRNTTFFITGATACAVLLGALLFSACRKEPRPITITGRLLEDCSEAPVANRRLRIIATAYRGFTGKESAAAFGTTAADGTFSMTVTMKDGPSEFELQDVDSSAAWNARQPQFSRTQGGIALGTFYRSRVLFFSLAVDVRQALGPTDTLYYATQAADQVFAQYPAENDTLVVSFPLTVPAYVASADPSPAPDSVDILWGVGRAAYDSSVNYLLTMGGNAPPLRRIRVPVYACSPGAGVGHLLIE